MELIDPNKYIGTFSKYGVPRVTEILSAMLHEDFLMTWANNIGLYKHQKYKDVLNTSADIGSSVHEAIENHVSGKGIFDQSKYPDDTRRGIVMAFNSFLEWWDIILKQNYKVLMQEHTLVCKYFGGTLDLLMEINGKIYIVDFKTSNHPSYKYFLQLAAYRYILMNEYNINPDGCLILMLDKSKCHFTELLLDFGNEEHLAYIEQCQETFLSLVYAYYNRGIATQMYTDIFGG